MTDETPYRVVVVDDDPDVVGYVAKLLQSRGGCEVVTVTDPRLVEDAVRALDADVVVTDIQMPGMNGIELLATLRRDRPYLRVVVMTAHVSVDYAIAALRERADEFFSKPLDPRQVVDTVQRLGAESRAARGGTGGQRVLAIGAHPDDVELGVGATLAAHRAAGDDVTILTLSRGARGGDVDDREQESRDAADLIGARLILEDLADTHIGDGDEARLLLERVIAEVAPTIVYTHSAHERHQDHRAVHEATIVAARRIAMVGCYESPSTTVAFQPTRFVAVDAHMPTKLALLDCFRSQAGIRDYLEHDYVLASARYWSRFGTGRHCEPLEILRDAMPVGGFEPGAVPPLG